MSWPGLDPGDLVLVPGWRDGYGHFTAATLNRLAAHHAAGARRFVGYPLA